MLTEVSIQKYVLVPEDVPRLCVTCVQDLDDMNIEIMRNTLYKAYLEDFNKFCLVRKGCQPQCGRDSFRNALRKVNSTSA